MASSPLATGVRRNPVHSVASTILAILATLFGLFVLAYVVLFVTKGRFLKHPFENYASKYADRPVRVAGDFQFYLNPHIKFYAEGLSVANPTWAHDRQLFTARRIDSEVGLWDLIRGERRVRYLDLDGGTVGAEIDAQGRNTWTFASDEPFKMPAIDRASITGTTAHFIDARNRADVNVRFGDVSASNPVDNGKVRVAGPLTFVGDGTALGAPFVVNGALTTPNAAMGGGRVGLKLHGEAAATVIDAEGTLPGVTRFDGADMRFNIVSQNVSLPLKLAGKTGPAIPVKLTGSMTPVTQGDYSGQSKLDLHADAADTHVDASGVLPRSNELDGTSIQVAVRGRNLQTAFKLFGLVSPATRPYRLSAKFIKDGKVYRFRDMNGRIGGSDIAGSMVADITGTKPLLTGDLHTKVLDILDVGPLIGYSPAAIDAKGVKAVIRTVAGTPRVIPDAPLAIEQLKAFDANIKYSAATIRTGNVKLANLKLALTLKDSDLHLTPIAFDIIGGRLTADIDLDASVRPVVTAYDIRMSRVPLGQLLTSFDVEKSGTTASVFGRVQLKGYGDTMRESLATSNGRIALVFPAGTLWVRNIELGKLDLQNYITAGLIKKLKKPQEIRCGVVAFTVKDGIAAADPVLFDTRRANFRGRGSFSFKNESLDLSIRGDSKEFSLVSGQSPVGIGGYFAAPAIHPISKQLIARAGVGVGLGLATGGIGALLAFVDIGDAKNSNCAAVEAAAPAAVVDAAPHDPKVKKKR
ncbi:AsmA family protein [Sphingosinicellaceae bacterium]|nr:AsmA family protein [Sphingosinicellaceae bacterium]